MGTEQRSCNASCTVKKIAEEYLENCGFGKELKKSFLDEIFGVQNINKKLCGLVDCFSDKDFEQELSALESVWNAREDNALEQCFHMWNIAEKVNTIKV